MSVSPPFLPFGTTVPTGFLSDFSLQNPGVWGTGVTSCQLLPGLPNLLLSEQQGMWPPSSGKLLTLLNWGPLPHEGPGNGKLQWTIENRGTSCKAKALSCALIRVISYTYSKPATLTPVCRAFLLNPGNCLQKVQNSEYPVLISNVWLHKTLGGQKNTFFFF